LAVGNVAALRREQGRRDEALKLFEEAIAHQEAALQANPRSATYRKHLRVDYENLAGTFLDLGNHEQAGRATRKMLEHYPNRPENLYSAARILARCVPLARADGKLPEPLRDQTAGSYADQAVALLRSSIDNGFRDAKRLQQDTSFEAVRPRQDFQHLLGRLNGQPDDKQT
jgi:tetratricopeptide (TPR) repeat protein